ncbi:MAG: DUF2939 domain-containing protein [Pelomonas sp.]|nr:DUF2939 domain-containing protein [Roseateles sp.]
MRWITGLALVAALCAFLATPWMAVHALRTAAANHDEVALAQRVDFERLRESVKLDLLNRLAGTGRDASSPADAPTRARRLGAAVAGALLGPMVDELVTPHNIALLLQGHRVVTGGAATSAPPPEIVSSGHYESLNRFVYAIRRGSDDEPVEFVFDRDGLSDWKLAELRFH